MVGFCWSKDIFEACESLLRSASGMGTSGSWAAHGRDFLQPGGVADIRGTDLGRFDITRANHENDTVLRRASALPLPK